MKYERSGTTGKIIEKELFGESRYKERSPEFEYYPYNVCVNLLKKLQPFPSIEPKPDFAKNVHQQVHEQLGLEARQLRFYTAVESPFDIFHGVDGWFEVSLGPDRYLRVTIDLTTNPNKEGYKADLVFTVPADGLDPTVDREQFLEYSNNLARMVVSSFHNHGLQGRERRAS